MAIVMERPRQVTFREIELTALRPDSYVAKTTMSGISSGTDMKTWLGLQPAESLYYPCVPGYENVGRIVHAQPEAKGFAVGDRVKAAWDQIHPLIKYVFDNYKNKTESKR